MTKQSEFFGLVHCDKLKKKSTFFVWFHTFHYDCLRHSNAKKFNALFKLNFFKVLALLDFFLVQANTLTLIRAAI